MLAGGDHAASDREACFLGLVDDLVHLRGGSGEVEHSVAVGLVGLVPAFTD